MISSASLFTKLMICFVLLCAFVRLSSTRAIFDEEDEDQLQAENAFLTNYRPASGRFARPYLHGLEIADNFLDHQQQLYNPTKQYNPDNVQLAKRIIMLPRVGRRSASHK